VLAVVNSQALIFPAAKDGCEDIAANENDEKDIMKMLVSPCVEDGEEDQPCCTNNGKGDGETREDLLPC
jgi:hypothetical protein